MTNIYTITRHDYSNGKISFYHNVVKLVRNKVTNLYENKGKEEELWFTINDKDIKDVCLTSNSVFCNGTPTVLDKHLMTYLRKTNAICKEHKELENWEETPFGRSQQNGYYIYETWDLSPLIK